MNTNLWSVSRVRLAGAFFSSLLVVSCLVGGTAWGQSGTISWIDFESVALAHQWQARGPIQLTREDVSFGAPADGPSGKMLMLSAEGRGAALTLADQWPLPPSLSECEAVSFWVRNLRADQQSLVFDVVFPEADLRATFWRKVEVASDRWEHVRVPLAWMRWETGRAPLWTKVSSFGIRTRGPARFCMDQIVFHDDDAELMADYRPRDLAELAFGADQSNIRVRASNDGWIITDEPRLQIDQLSAHLAIVLAAMRRDFQLADSAPPPRIIVFSRDADYRRFVVQFAERLGAVASPPTSDGYHLQGVALSSWLDSHGTLRPVYTHEFCHSVLSHAARIDSAKSDWLQEGVANYYQLRFHPQENFAEIVRQGLRSERLRSPWTELCAGDNVPLDRYWQVATLLGMMIDREPYRSRLPQLLETLRVAGSTDLRPHLDTLFGVTWEQLDADWQQWCREKF